MRTWCRLGLAGSGLGVGEPGHDCLVPAHVERGGADVVQRERVRVQAQWRARVTNEQCADDARVACASAAHASAHTRAPV